MAKTSKDASTHYFYANFIRHPIQNYKAGKTIDKTISFYLSIRYICIDREKELWLWLNVELVI